MSDVTVEEDVSGPGGHARIRVRGAAQAQQSPGFMLRRPDWAEAVLGPAGWQVSEILLSPQRASVDGNDLVLLVGPEVCGHLEGGVYEIAVPAAGVEAPVYWPEIATPPPPPPPSPPVTPPAPPDATTILQRPAIPPPIVEPPPLPPPVPPRPVPPPGPRWGIWALVVLVLLAILGGALKALHLYPFETTPALDDKLADVVPPPAPHPPPAPPPAPPAPPPHPAPTPPAPPPPAPPHPTPPPPAPPPPAPPPPTPPPPPRPTPPPPPPQPSPDAMSLRELMARNRPDEMYAQAQRRMPTQPADALALLQRAGDDLHYGPALGALGQVYDPNKPPKGGVPSNARQAAQHYRDAMRAGQGSVAADRAALRLLLEIRQAAGDSEARAILQEFWP